MKLTFAFMAAAAGNLEAQALTLAASIRAFAGQLSGSPIWVFVPGTEDNLSAQARQELAALDARLWPLELTPEARKFPFAAKAYAAAAAESAAQGQTDLLLCMDTASLIVNEPGELLLAGEKNLGYRPVDHTLVGSTYAEPIDPFWELVYRKCDVPADRLFPMTGSVDQNVIRPYFNAGFLDVRPERGLLRAWRDNFERLYLQDAFKAFYQKDDLYAIFVHQALLAGTVLARLERQELYEFHHHVNYPLHMHDDYPAARRPLYVNDLVSLRYEQVFQKPDWKNKIPLKPPLTAWLEAQPITRKQE